MEQRLPNLKTSFDFIMEMVIIGLVYSGVLTTFNQCYLPIQKTALRPFLSLISRSGGLIGVRRGRREITAKIISKGHLL